MSYLPTASLLARRREHSAGWAPPWRRSLLALAAAQGVDPLAETGRLPVLPNAGREAEAIAHSLPGRTAVFTGDAAGKHALVAGVAEGVPLVHLAAHTAISEETPQRSRILLGRDALFLGEAAQLDMRRVDLVTLSACETERGRLVEGEGIASFSRAFLAAGARAVITTLWRVSDRPTASFMQALYHQLARGETKADALARAKREFLRSGGPLAHPYYWAAFVLNGEGWEPAPLPVSWAATLLASGALMLALAWWRRKRDRV